MNELIVIPPSELETETLEAIIEEYISREGTDYGLEEVDLATQKRRALAALERKEITIVFDSAANTVQLVSTEEFNKPMLDR